MPGRPTGSFVRRLTPRRITLALLPALAVAGIAAALRPKAVEVETALMRRAPMRVTVDEEGRTRVRDRYAVTAPVAGWLHRVPLTEGDVVEAGDVVARISPLPLDAPTTRQASARLSAARAMRSQAETLATAAAAVLEQVRRETERTRRLHAAGALSRQHMEQAELTLRSHADDLAAARARAAAADAEVDQAAAALLHTAGDRDGLVLVRAPAGGRVLRLAERSARVITPGAPIAEIGDTRALEVAVDVLSSDAARICEGMQLTLEGWGADSMLQGVVRRVEPAATTRLSALGVEEQRVNVIADINDPPSALGDGFRVDVRIIVWESDDELVLPAGALIRVGDGWGAYVVEQGRARLRHIRVGQLGGGGVQVEDGLMEGERVILFPSDRIREGTRVRPRGG